MPYDAEMGEVAAWAGERDEHKATVFVMFNADGYPETPLTAEGVKGDHFALLLPSGDVLPPLPGFATKHALTERAEQLTVLQSSSPGRG